METLAVVGVNIALALLQLLDLRWVIDQATCGNITPLSMWTIFVAFTGFTVGYIVGKKRAGYVPKRKIACGFSQEVKRAAANALEADRPLVLGEYWESVIGFSRRHEDVFTFAYPLDEVGDADTYDLSPEWRSYLRKHKRHLE